MEVRGVSCTTCTKKQSMIMAYLYHKNRSPYWYIQYVDSDGKKHDKSTGFRADDPNDTVKASSASCEPNKCRLRRNLMKSLGWRPDALSCLAILTREIHEKTRN